MVTLESGFSYFWAIPSCCPKEGLGGEGFSITGILSGRKGGKWLYSCCSLKAIVKLKLLVPETVSCKCEGQYLHIVLHFHTREIEREREERELFHTTLWIQDWASFYCAINLAQFFVLTGDTKVFFFNGANFFHVSTRNVTFERNNYVAWLYFAWLFLFYASINFLLICSKI